MCLPRITSADVEAEIDEEIQNQLEAAEDQDAVLAIAPRKPNWDLKRDVIRKMDVLQARTDRAVVQLIRRRIQGQKASPKVEAKPDDEHGQRDEAAFALAREVGKVGGAPRASDSDDEEEDVPRPTKKKTRA